MPYEVLGRLIGYIAFQSHCIFFSDNSTGGNDILYCNRRVTFHPFSRTRGRREIPSSSNIINSFKSKFAVKIECDNMKKPMVTDKIEGQML